MGESQKARAKLTPRDHILYQTVNRLPVANQIFLGYWTVTSTRRVTARNQLPKEDIQHTPETVLPLHTKETKRLG